MLERVCRVTVLAIALCPSVARGQSFVYPVGNPHERPIRTLPNANGFKVTRGYTEIKHTGVDLADGTEGKEVRAIGAGKVVIVQSEAASRGWGNVVLIRHDLPDGTFYSLYGHLQNGSVVVSETDSVKAGALLGKVDCTGNTEGQSVCPSNGGTGPHLHLGIRKLPNLGCGYITAKCKSGDTFDNWLDPLQFIAEHQGTENHSPVGSLDGINPLNQVFGWARDPDDPEVALDVHLYIDKNAGESGAIPTAVKANEFRPDVGNHAFNWDVPSTLRDGRTHTVWAWGIDLTDPVNNNAQLQGAPPTTFIISPPAANRPPTAGFSMSSGSQIVVNTETLNSFADRSTGLAQVSLSDTSTDPDGENDIVVRRWAIDNGASTFEGKGPFTKALPPGSHTISLQVEALLSKLDGAEASRLTMSSGIHR